MYYNKLSNHNWKIIEQRIEKIIEQRIEKKMSGWKGKLVSIGGRLVLINSVLTSLVMFMISFLEVFTPGFKAKIRCSSYVCTEIICHTYNQNYSI
jgi:hypothetical protein